MPSSSPVILVIFIFLPLLKAVQSHQPCSGSCNCSYEAPGSLTASCRLNNLNELNIFLQRPQDVRVLYLKITSTQKSDGELRVDLSSLQVLVITGNTNWSIPEEFLKFPKLREIKGATLGKGCTNCTLMKDYQDDAVFTSIQYVPDQGYRLQNVCVEQDITLYGKYRSFSRNNFFPKCIMNDKNCQIQLGTIKTRNHCLELGSPMLFASTFIGVTAIGANLFVFVVILFTEKLRKKPSMVFVCSLAFSDILVASYVVSLGILYQMITPENVRSQLNQVCPYLGFLAISGFAFTALFSFLITLQRYLVIVFSLKPHLHMRTKSTLFCLFVATVIALILATWALLTPGVFKERETCIPVYGRESKQDTAFGLSNMSICGLFYAGTFGLYVKIFTTAKKTGSRIGIDRKVQLAKRIGAIVCTNFALGFIPFVIACVGISVASQGEVNYDIWILLGIYLPLICASLNALIDPFLYAYRNAQFKKILKQKWEKMRPRRKQGASHKNCNNTAAAIAIRNFRQPPK